MNLKYRSCELELLDRDDIPDADIRRNMEELEMINAQLGGHRITVLGLRKLLGGRKQISICEIGCGGGDNLVALKKWCDKKGVSVQFTGIDMKPACIAVAKAQPLLQGNAQWIISNYRQVQFARQPDIIFSSLFCHHFTNAQLAAQLQWMQKNSTVGFFINDLHRHLLAYHSIKILTRLFSKSYLVKNDAPLSVARGLKRKEWLGLLRQAGMENAVVEWKWAFRWLVSFRKKEN